MYDHSVEAETLLFKEREREGEREREAIKYISQTHVPAH
jgi:hypothetical protein